MAGAYIVFVALILIYVAIMAVRAQRMERELDELQRDVRGGPVRLARSDRERETVVSELLAIGVSHKTAPVEVRERLALPEARAAEFMRDLRGAAEVHEAVAISTCNRTELYLVVGDPVEAESTRAGDAGPPGRDPPHRAGHGDLLAPQLRRRPPPVPRGRPGWSR